MDRYAELNRLHEAGCFVLANPWDRGSARLFELLGFRALGTTSAGLSFSRARPDAPDALDLDVTLTNIREIVEATSLPVSADFQSGYGEDADAVRASVAACIDTGVAGLSIEDTTGSAAKPLFEIDEAVDRLRAARAAIDASGRPVVLTARAECFLVGHEDPLRASIARLTAYAEAGADCLYAPGIRTRDDVRALVEAVAPKPVNVLVADPSWMSVATLGELGVRRISVGSAFARVAWAAVTKAAREAATEGTFACLADAEPFATLNALFDARST